MQKFERQKEEQQQRRERGILSYSDYETTHLALWNKEEKKFVIDFNPPLYLPPLSTNVRRVYFRRIFLDCEVDEGNLDEENFLNQPISLYSPQLEQRPVGDERRPFLEIIFLSKAKSPATYLYYYGKISAIYFGQSRIERLNFFLEPFFSIRKEDKATPKPLPLEKIVNGFLEFGFSIF